MLCDGRRPVGRLHRRNCENVTLSAKPSFTYCEGRTSLEKMVPDLDNRSTAVGHQCTLRATRDRMPNHFNLAKPQCSSRQDVSRLGVKHEPDTDSSIPPLRPSWVYDAVYLSSSHRSVSLVKIQVIGSYWCMFAGGRTALAELAGRLWVLLEMEAQARLYLATYTDLLEISPLFFLMKQAGFWKRLSILIVDTT